MRDKKCWKYLKYLLHFLYSKILLIKFCASYNLANKSNCYLLWPIVYGKIETSKFLFTHMSKGCIWAFFFWKVLILQWQEKIYVFSRSNNYKLQCSILKQCLKILDVSIFSWKIDLYTSQVLNSKQGSNFLLKKDATGTCCCYWRNYFSRSVGGSQKQKVDFRSK